MIVAPSILSADFNNLEKEITFVSDNKAMFLHIDVMDGHFVPNITIGPCVIKSIRKTSDLIFDVHLMIENPEKYYEEFFKAGADVITFHYEAVEDSLNLIKKIKALGIKAGISIKPETDIEKITSLLDDVDLVLVMSVSPGFGGQKFMPSALSKIAFLSEYKKSHNLDYIIEVDGGINEETGKECANSGAEVLVAGSYIFNNEDPVKAINSLIKL